MQAWPGHEGAGEDEHEENDEGEQPELTRRAFKVCIIDGRESMNVKGMMPERPSQLCEVLAAISEFFKELAIKADGTQIAVLVTGVTSVSASAAAEFARQGMKVQAEGGVLRLGPMSQPSAKLIRALLAYTNKSDAFPADFTQAGAGTPGLYDEAMAVSLRLFREAKAKPADASSILIFTNDDAPPDQAPALSKAGDVRQDGITLKLFPLAHPYRCFDLGRFWRSLLAKGSAVPLPRAEGGDDDDDPDNEEDLGTQVLTSMASLVDSLHKREQRKRVWKRVLLRLAPGVSISVALYHNIHTAHRPSSKRAVESGAGGKFLAVKSVSSYVDRGCAVAGPVAKEDILQTRTVGGKAVLFSSAEVKSLGKVVPAPGAGGGTMEEEEEEEEEEAGEGGADAGADVEEAMAGASSSAAPTAASAGAARPRHPAPPVTFAKGLTILGFQPRSTLRETDNVKPPVLVYPTDQEVAGSRAAFRALWERMLVRDVIAIALLVGREGESPVPMALLPEREEVDEEGIQVAPPGLYAITLPFADDFRRIDLAPALNAVPTHGLMDAARALVADYSNPKWSLRSARTFNPALQRFYRGLESIALRTDNPGLDPAKSAAGLGALANAPARDSLHAFVNTETGFETKAGVKRGRDGAGAGPAKAAAEDIDEESMLADGTLEKATVPQLKAVCARRGLKVGGVKGDLVQRITDAVAKKEEVI
jgi:hypothetical protein